MGSTAPSKAGGVGDAADRERSALFTKLYWEELAYVWRTLRRLGVPDRDVPDVAHDFWIVVFRRLHLYDRTRPVRPWLFGIAYRVVSDYRRSARVMREVLAEPPEMPDQAPLGDEQVAASQARAELMQLLDGLDLDRRAVFVMHDIEEQPGPEIARALEIPLATVHSRLRLAREDLAAAARRLQAKGKGNRP